MKSYNKLLLTSLLAPSLILVGCGGGGSSSSNSSSSSVSSSSESSSSESSSSESSSSSSAASETVFMLYEDGPATLALDEGINNTLVPGGWADWGAGGSFLSEPGTADGENTVWQVELVPSANVFLSTSDMSAYEDVDAGVKFTDVAATGELRFDLKILTIDAETDLQIKLDSGYPNVSYMSIDVPEAEVWTPVTIPFADLVALGEGQAVNYDNVTNVFVIEAVGGTADVQLDNIRIVCPAESGCDLDPVPAPENEAIESNFFVFEDALNTALWEGLAFGYYLGEGYKPTTINAEMVAATDHGDVLQLTFGSGFGTMYVQSATTSKDLSAFAAGNLVFDIRVTNWGDNTGDFKVKAEGGSSGPEIDFTVDALNTWETKTIAVATLAVPDLADVNTPISIFPVDNQQDGLVVQIDNIRWELAE